MLAWSGRPSPSPASASASSTVRGTLGAPRVGRGPRLRPGPPPAVGRPGWRRGRPRRCYDLAATLMRQPFDRERPLWEFVTIEGLRGRPRSDAAAAAPHDHRRRGRHPAVGASSWTSSASPTPASPPAHRAPRPSDAPPHRRSRRRPRPPRSPTAAATHAQSASGADRRPRSAAPPPRVDAARRRTPARGTELTAVARSTMRQVDRRARPLTAVDRALARIAGSAPPCCSLEDVARGGPPPRRQRQRPVHHRRGHRRGTVHAAAGMPVDELRVSMPVSTRHDRSAGGNAFSPTQTLVPTGAMDVRGALRRDPRDPDGGEDRAGRSTRWKARPTPRRCCRRPHWCAPVSTWPARSTSCARTCEPRRSTCSSPAASWRRTTRWGRSPAPRST